MQRRNRKRTRLAADPFAPIEVAVDAILALLGFTLLLGVGLLGVSALAGERSDATLTFFSFEETVCVTADAGPIGTMATDPVPGRPAFPSTTSRGTTSTDSYRVCVAHASLGEQVAASAEGLLSLALTIGVALLIRSAIRTARRDGLFTDRTARAVRRLGWVLIVASVLVPVATKIGIGVVVAAAVADQGWAAQLATGTAPSFPLLLTGLGVLSFARILRLAVPLQEEVALTV